MVQNIITLFPPAVSLLLHLRLRELTKSIFSNQSTPGCLIQSSMETPFLSRRAKSLSWKRIQAVSSTFPSHLYLLLTDSLSVWLKVRKIDGSARGLVPTEYLKRHTPEPTPPPAPPAPPVAPSRAVFQPPVSNEINGINGSLHTPAVKAKAAPPDVPTRPGARKKPAPPPNPRASATSTAASNADSGWNTPELAGGSRSSGIASGLAAAIHAQEEMKRKVR